MLKLLLPGIRIWLDVDNPDDVGKLEASVKLSVTFIIFLSKGYFESLNCRRELYTALQDSIVLSRSSDEESEGVKNPRSPRLKVNQQWIRKPLIPIWEADENKGGASLAQLKQEVRDFCDESLPEYPGYGCADEVMPYGTTNLVKPLHVVTRPCLVTRLLSV